MRDTQQDPDAVKEYLIVNECSVFFSEQFALWHDLAMSTEMLQVTSQKDSKRSAIFFLSNIHASMLAPCCHQISHNKRWSSWKYSPTPQRPQQARPTAQRPFAASLWYVQRGVQLLQLQMMWHANQCKSVLPSPSASFVFSLSCFFHLISDVYFLDTQTQTMFFQRQWGSAAWSQPKLNTGGIPAKNQARFFGIYLASPEADGFELYRLIGPKRTASEGSSVQKILNFQVWRANLGDFVS